MTCRVYWVFKRKKFRLRRLDEFPLTKLLVSTFRRRAGLHRAAVTAQTPIQKEYHGKEIVIPKEKIVKAY